MISSSLRLLDRWPSFSSNFPSPSLGRGMLSQLLPSPRSRARASCSSFAFRAALWLSVSLMMFLRNRVFGLGALLIGLERSALASSTRLLSCCTSWVERLAAHKRSISKHWSSHLSPEVVQHNRLRSLLLAFLRPTKGMLRRCSRSRGGGPNVYQILWCTAYEYLPVVSRKNDRMPRRARTIF